jgi:hypothetical protein
MLIVFGEAILICISRIVEFRSNEEWFIVRVE